MLGKFNLLHGSSSSRSESSWRLTAARIAIAVLAVAALLVIPLALVATPVAVNAMRGRALITQAIDEAKSGNYQLSATHSKDAADAFGSAASGARRLQFLAVLPGSREYADSAVNLLDSGRAGSSAMAELMTVVVSMSSVLGDTEGVATAINGADLGTFFRDLRPESRQALLASFVESLPHLRSASADVASAIDAYDRLPTSGVGAELRLQLDPIFDRLASVRNLLASVMPVAEVLPAAMGYPESRNYLVFFQNNTELRPTGGFLGVFGFLTVKNAEIQSIKTEDIYAIDGPSESLSRPVPPAPFSKYLGVNKWFLRDANWSPDFPASAAMMEKFFHDEAMVAWGEVPEVHGIIAITPEIVKGIFSVIGPIEVDGITFNADNFVDRLEYEVEKGFAEDGLPVDARKGIIGRLTQEVMVRLTSASWEQMAALVHVFEDNAREGHVMFWMRDPILQSMVADNGWDGAMPPVIGDYVQVVDANLASLKTDSVVNRSYAYSIVPEGNGYIGTVRIEYRNRGTFTWKTTRYRTYTRVYVPSGTELIGVSGAMLNDKLKDPRRQPGTPDVGDELGRRWFGAFISIEPGETRALEFKFRLAPSVVRALEGGEYRLDFAKQLGTVAPGLTLNLDFGKKVKTAQPAEDQAWWGDNVYRLQTDARENRVFEVGF